MWIILQDYCLAVLPYLFIFMLIASVLKNLQKIGKKANIGNLRKMVIHKSLERFQFIVMKQECRYDASNKMLQFETVSQMRRHRSNHAQKHIPNVDSRRLIKLSSGFRSNSVLCNQDFDMKTSSPLISSLM